MRTRLLSACSILAVAAPALAADFEKPVRLKAGDDFVRVEAPGYAAPCVADVDRDGKPDLLVGQFKDGRIKVYKGQDKMKFAPGDWLKTEGEIAKIPGVW